MIAFEYADICVLYFGIYFIFNCIGSGDGAHEIFYWKCNIYKIETMLILPYTRNHWRWKREWHTIKTRQLHAIQRVFVSDCMWCLYNIHSNFFLVQQVDEIITEKHCRFVFKYSIHLLWKTCSLKFFRVFFIRVTSRSKTT